MKTFVIEIPNERLKTYKKVAFIILTLNFLGFGYVFLKTTDDESFIAVAGLVLNAVPWLYFLLNKKHIKSPLSEFVFILSSFIWVYFGNIWMGIMLLLFAVMSFFTNKKTIVTVNDECLIYPSFPVKKYLWSQITSVMCKDDILTIDLKDNKLLQLNIEHEFAADFNSVGFNEWCTKKISAVETVQ